MTTADKFHFSIRFLANFFLIAVLTVIILMIGSKPNDLTKQSLGGKPNKNPKEQILAACKNSNSNDCYTDNLKEVLHKDGIKTALTSLADLTKVNTTVNNYCHSFAHVLGREAYDQTGGDIGKIFTEGNTTCWSGFIHGALEKAFSKSTDLAQTANDLCTEKHGVKGSFLYYQCLHGLGHGLSARYNNEIYLALGICEKLADSYQQNSCYGGVFMENYAADNINHKTKYTDSLDPIAPCNKVEEKFKYNCYQLVSIQILRLNSYNFAQAFQTCEKSEGAYLDVCYQSVGRDVSGYNAEDPTKSLADCALGNLRAEEQCIRAVAMDSVYSKASANFVGTTCSQAKEILKTACYQAAGSGISALLDNITDRVVACGKFEKNYIETCEVAAGAQSS